VLEISILCTNRCWKSFTPLLNSRVDDVLVKTAPDHLNQPLFQFINALDVGLHMVNRFLNGRPYLIVNRVEL